MAREASATIREQNIESLDPYAERILEAARGLLIEHGLRRTSLADIARAAAVSEATLYRRFESREDLLRALVAREVRAFIARVDEHVGRIDDPEEALVAAWLIFARALREHDLVQRLLVTDPERILPLLTTDGGPALALGREYVLAMAKRSVEHGAQLTANPEHIAEILARIAQSLVLTPESTLPLDDEQALADLGHALLAPMLLPGRGGATGRTRRPEVS